MDVLLLAHTQLSGQFLMDSIIGTQIEGKVTDGSVVALSAIRTCYSHNKPSEIVELEGEKYFGSVASDGKGGSDADRLLRHIVNSGHTSTLEHITFTFAIEGVSRSLLAQLTRHRHFSYSVQSQRYVKFGSGDRAKGFDYVTPWTVAECEEATKTFDGIMSATQLMYDELRELGIPAEDARYILPNAATCNLVLTGNLRSILEFYSKRGEGTHAQWEIKDLAEKIKEAVVECEPWTATFFEKHD